MLFETAPPPNTFVFKYIPDDFRVTECSVLETSHQKTAEFGYYLLSKRGLTTQHAVELVASKLGVPPRAICYSGRKDEDAITTQYISIPTNSAATVERETAIFEGTDNWVHIERIGYGRSALEIGGLDANAFRLIVRNIPEQQAKQLAQRGGFNTYCLNYYDAQRFGVPGQPKVAHLIGQKIFEELWDEAIKELQRSGTPEAAMAASWDGSPSAFFSSLDPRVRDFFLASNESYRWNTALRDVVFRTCAPSERSSIFVDGIEYLLADASSRVAKIACEATELPYFRYDSSSGCLQRRRLFRPTAIQALIKFGEPKPDEFFPGHWCLPMRFSLPSGCYATMVLRQMRVQFS